MKTFKIASIILSIVAISYASYVASSFDRSMGKSFEFAQSQAKTGSAFMDSMTQADYLEAAALASALMAEPPPEWNWRTLSNTDQRDVPEEWKARGIVFIRYRPTWVSFGWHGGPHAHTSLEVDRKDDASIVFTAHYNDNTPRKQLKVMTQAEQSSENHFPAPHTSP